MQKSLLELLERPDMVSRACLYFLFWTTDRQSIEWQIRESMDTEDCVADSASIGAKSRSGVLKCVLHCTSLSKCCGPSEPIVKDCSQTTTAGSRPNSQVCSQLVREEDCDETAKASCTSCQVCLELKLPEELISPCVCRGSIEAICYSCLENTLRAKIETASVDLSCPTCKHDYEGPVAVKLGKFVLDQVQKTHEAGQANVLVPIAMRNLAGAYLRIGDASNARDVCQRALRIQESAESPDEAQIGATLSLAGYAFFKLGDLDRSRDLLTRAIELNERACGRDHPTVATTLVFLACLHHTCGQYSRQREVLERALQIFEAAHGPESYKLVDCLQKLATFYGTPQHKDLARRAELLQRALRISERVYGPNHRLLLTTLRDLGTLFGQLGEFRAKEQLILRALHIAEREYGLDHTECSKIIMILGNTYAQLGDVDTALDYLERARKIQERSSGSHNHELLSIYMSLSLVHKMRGDAPSRRRALEKSLSMMEQRFGPRHANLQVVLSDLAQACEQMGDIAEHTRVLERLRAVRTPGPSTPRDQSPRPTPR